LHALQTATAARHSLLLLLLLLLLLSQPLQATQKA
jgi:hypothetical protein